MQKHYERCARFFLKKINKSLLFFYNANIKRDEDLILA